MNRKRRPPIALALIATAALITACGSSTPTAATVSGGNRATVQKAVTFAGCMRHNGVSDFPDLGPGKLTIDAIANGSSVDTSSPAFTRALAACKDLEPTGFTGPGKRSPQQISAALRFAQCIRNNGVSDFPDPINGQPLVDTNRIPSSSRPGGIAALNAAMRTCSRFSEALGIHR
jgi:hypothetical protein